LALARADTSKCQTLGLSYRVDDLAGDTEDLREWLHAVSDRRSA
jgi:hypothetical protein